jgi:hypothetical protein
MDDLGELKAIAERIEQRGYKRGLAEADRRVTEAYRKGWADGQAEAAKQLKESTAQVMARMQDAVIRAVEMAKTMPPPRVVGAQYDTLLVNNLPLPGMTNVTPGLPPPRSNVLKGVLQIIREKPGLRGVDIVARALERGVTDQERTVRTALRRLRIRTYIGRNPTTGGWHPTAGTSEPTEFDALGLAAEEEEE